MPSFCPGMTLGQALQELLAVHQQRPKAQQQERVHELLSLVGLPAEAFSHLPHESGGGQQRQRIDIARAVALEPGCTVADEL